MSSRETFDRYAAAWGTVDVAKILPFYGLPCIFVAPTMHVVATNEAELTALIQPMVEAMRASDYARSDVSDVQTRALGADLEQVTCQVTRFNRSGEPILRTDAVYFWRRDGGRWRVVATFGGDPVIGGL